MFIMIFIFWLGAIDRPNRELQQAQDEAMIYESHYEYLSSDSARYNRIYKIYGKDTQKPQLIVPAPPTQAELEA